MPQNLRIFSSIFRFYTALSKSYILCPKIVASSFLVSTVKYSSIQPQLKIMKLDTPQFHAIFTPETKALSKIFKKYGYEIRIAGGAVRDLLMNQTPVDVDFATTATPDEMKQMFTTEGVRMFNRKGEGHGTVTVRVNDQQNFEITTLRVDLHTDGRHAEVEFTTSWELDASRRDLTINAMFLSLDGTLYDYFHGIEDLEKRKVKFVGDPTNRIKEDYLRILRYFRFYGRIALTPDDHDPKILEAIRLNMGGLERIAGERLWVELKKILDGNFAKELVLQVIDLGIAPYIGLPSEPDTIEYEIVCDRSESLKPQAVTRLVSLLRNEEEVLNLHSRLRFSKYERELALFIINNRDDKICEEPLKPYKMLLLETKYKLSDTQEWVYEVLKYRGESHLLEKMKEWQMPKFPINGHILIQKGFKSGLKLNEILTKLKTLWIESNFQLTQEQLLEKLETIAKKS